MAAFYRVRQFVRAVGARSRIEDESLFVARQYLPVEAVALFQAQPRYDRRHSLAVFRTLTQAGHHHPDLLAAALLHDVGKTRSRDAATGGGLQLWHRVAVVLMRAMAPDLLVKAGRDQPGSWRRPFWVQLHHAEIGAGWARQAGCSETTVEIIRRHEDDLGPGSPLSPRIHALLVAFQAADGTN